MPRYFFVQRSENLIFSPLFKKLSIVLSFKGNKYCCSSLSYPVFFHQYEIEKKKKPVAALKLKKKYDL